MSTSDKQSNHLFLSSQGLAPPYLNSFILELIVNFPAKYSLFPSLHFVSFFSQYFLLSSHNFYLLVCSCFICFNIHLFDLYSFEILKDITAERQNLKSKNLEALQSRSNSPYLNAQKSKMLQCTKSSPFPVGT